MPVIHPNDPPCITLVCDADDEAQAEIKALDDGDRCVSIYHKGESIWLTMDDADALITHLQNCINFNKEQNND